MTGRRGPAALVPAPAARRLTQLFTGLVLYAVSIALLVHPGLGTMPWDVLSQGVARRTGLSLGTVIVLTSVLVLLCWIPLRQRPGLGTVANVVVIGALVDPALALMDAWLPDPGMPVRIALAAAGIVTNALATGLYVGAGLGPGPRDGLMTGLVRRTGRPVALVRTSIEVVVVLTGVALGGTFGPATIAYALLVGPLVGVVLPRTTIAAPAPEPAREPAVTRASDPA
ncbi:YczE/YyaS/YitT family protein [Cellulomonas massiliensis]|uniref:membrane protein YczE n=1 Tax=Cellulomonas massiliensis TaxID=1465811 RepID=UPI00030C99B4|nr:membrane protein [Cellulomonas massiliensis]